MAVFLAISGIIYGWLFGGAKSIDGRDLFKSTAFVATAEGAGTIPTPVNVPSVQLENAMSYGAIVDVRNLDLSPDALNEYSEGFIKDHGVLWSKVSTTTLSR
jgi:hypothetical protein